MSGQIALHIDRNYHRRTHVCRKLKSLGLELHKASTTPAAKKLVKEYCYDLVLAHFDTIGKEIFEFCSLVRSSNIHTILMVLMANSRVSIEEQLFDYGVNDVVIGRQTSARILTKRIRVHLRNGRSLPHSANTIMLKNTIVNFERREVWCNGAIRRLPGILADLLKYFMDNPNRIISREELYESPIWADSICSPAKEGGRTFDVNVGKLRRIIEPNPTQPQIIKSVRGIGWKLATDVIA